MAFGILGASLAAMALVLGLTSYHQQQAAQESLQHRGVELARLVANSTGADREELHAQISRVLRFQASNPNFAFGAVVDTSGQILVNVPSAAPLPAAPVDPAQVTGWMQQRETALPSGTGVLEFFGPIRSTPSSDATSATYYRLGFRAPTLAMELQNLSFLAAIALPVFLLAPLCVFLLRREVTPIAQIAAQMDQLIQAQKLDELQATAPKATGEFVEKFNSFVGYAQHRIEKSNAVSSKLITSERFLNYRMARLESLLEALPDGLLWFDSSGDLLTVNQRARQIFGKTKEELQQTPPSAWSSEPEITNFFGKFRPDGPQSIDAVTLDITEGNANCLEFSAYVVKQPASKKQRIGTLVLIRDATSEALAKRSRSEFIANVAHELKSPLNTLRLYTDSLVDEGDDAEIRLEATQIIQDEVDRLARLINNLLNITQIEMGNLQIQAQRTRLDALVRDAYQAIGRSDDAQALDLQLQMPDELPSVSIDKELMRIAINNLLTNAVKYSDPGDQVRVTVMDNHDAIVVAVQDSGIGIAPDEQANIFDKFYRAKDGNAAKRGGHGLGLALAREIVQLHHGTLRIDSTLGEGSTFSIELWKSTGLVKEAI